ncbi:MAG: hypothetical protein ACKO85_02320 [Isosphaeraceae bacterium]
MEPLHITGSFVGVSLGKQFFALFPAYLAIMKDITNDVATDKAILHGLDPCHQLFQCPAVSR